MITSHFLLLLVGIFIVALLFGIVASLISNKKSIDIPESFSHSRTYWKFTDQADPSIDDVITDFKLLDD